MTITNYLKDMKRIANLILTLGVLISTAHAQDTFFTKSGRISFFSKAPLENIEAGHRSVTCVLDKKIGLVQFSLLMKGFEFEKALMQEHFNENYIESDKYPKSTFRGQITNNSDVNYASDGSYPAKVKGSLSIHGETRTIETSGTIEVKSGKILLKAEFPVLLSDYKISIPSINKDNVSNTIRITVDCSLEPLKN
jgi:hypothetical protein